MRSRIIVQSAAAALMLAAGQAAAQATYDQSQLLGMGVPFGNGTITSVTASGDGVLLMGNLGDEDGDFSRIVWSVDNFSPALDFSGSMTVGVLVTLEEFNVPYASATPFVQTDDGMGNFDFVEGANQPLSVGQTVEFTVDLSGAQNPAMVTRFGMQVFGPGPLFPGEEPIVLQIDPLPPLACGPADMNADGSLNNTDINLFVNQFLAGCQATSNGMGANPYTPGLNILSNMGAIVGSINSSTDDATGSTYNAEMADGGGFTQLSLAYLYPTPADVSSNDFIEVEVTVLSGEATAGRIVVKEGPDYLFVTNDTTEFPLGVPTVVSLPTDLLETPDDIREINFEFYGAAQEEITDNTVEVRVRPLSSSCGPADMNADGSLNNTDIDLFVNFFLTGCP